ncbi:MAG: CRISPR system precrRNA processing endoribonuclease RAMP protein Cas6 [Desulfuromonadales bacterium]|jgi:hypothetical protein
MADYPHLLQEFEFAQAHFLLEFQEPFHLTSKSLLRLRKDLRRAGGVALLDREGKEPDQRRFSALFDPPLTTDPVALRRFQRSGPPFVFLPPSDAPEEFLEGDVLNLPVMFLGKGIRLLADFARTLETLGPIGLYRGEGRFELAGIEAEDAAGRPLPLWGQGQRLDNLAPPLCNARWFLEDGVAPGLPLCLEFVTPARLMSGGRPLFQTDFTRLFPFILRRVASMAHAHCGVELVEDPGPLLTAARKVRVIENLMIWQDWRLLEGPEKSQDLGGLVGHLLLEGETLDEVRWVLKLGSLLNLGKSAAYGAGHYRVRESAV